MCLAAGDALDVTRVSDAGYYAESRGVFSGPKFSYPPALKKDVLLVDTAATATPLGGDDTEAEAEWPKDGALIANLDKFSNPAVTNATTTTCDKGHHAQNVVREGGPAKYKIADTRGFGAYEFHMIRGTLNLRTVRETKAEASRAQRELFPKATKG